MFDDIVHSPRTHLGLLVHEAAFRVIHHLLLRASTADAGLEKVFEDFPYLEPYFAELRSRLPEDIEWYGSMDQLSAGVQAWEDASPQRLPLRALRVEAGLDRRTVLAFVLCGAVEESAVFADLFARIQSEGGERPSMELLHGILAGPAGQSMDAWDLCRPLCEAGFVEVQNLDKPRSNWSFRVPAAIWNSARGDTDAQPSSSWLCHRTAAFRPVGDLILPEKVRRQLAELGPLLDGAKASALMIRGLPGTDRVEVAGSIAAQSGYGLMEVQWNKDSEERAKHLGPLCTLTCSIPAFVLDLGPGETFEPPPLRGFRGPLILILGPEGGVSGPAVERGITIHLQTENEQDRRLQWERGFQNNPVEDLSSIASTFCVPGRYIRQSAHLAVTYASLDGRRTVTMEDVRLAVRSINRQSMDTLSTRLEAGTGWRQVVVRRSTEEHLRTLERRCLHRERLSAFLQSGFPGGLNRGVRALFEGPSGTGKTLAARTLAGILQRDIYRVDLASVVNKYIGETEKNLSRVLSRAEDLDVVLLLDEGDSLMTRRTEVKSANDRYANLETNYLLQRLDTYTGVLIVTTNSGNNIDSAFRRRMDVVVSFHLPDTAERWRLWHIHLPCNHSVSAAAMEMFALRYVLTGGQIRNAAIHAAMLALDRGDGVITESDVRSGIQVEYRKAGASCPVEEEGSYGGNEIPLNQFMGAIS
ncbi:MAG: ATP-binding protein [Bryobacteraceae bacterium]